MKHDLHSIGNEPQFQQGPARADPTEDLPLNRENQSDLNRVRDSVYSEPTMSAHPASPSFANYLQRKRAEASPASAYLWALAAGAVAGPFALLGAVFGQEHGYTPMFAIVVVAPAVEEIVKQSGLMYLLEKKPWLLLSTAQFPLCAAVTALVFATVENLIYIYGYAADLPAEARPGYAQFRWIVCTGLHVGCSMIASIGMVRVWKRTILQGKPANMSHAANFILIAAIIHGLYNAVAVAFDDVWM